MNLEGIQNSIAVAKLSLRTNGSSKWALDTIERQLQDSLMSTIRASISVPGNEDAAAKAAVVGVLFGIIEELRSES